jgi:hypothetical protein
MHDKSYYAARAYWQQGACVISGPGAIMVASAEP